MARIVSVAARFAIFMFGATEIQCGHTVRNIAITQKEEGIGKGKKPEWNVTISNPCLCTVLDLTKIEPSVLAEQEDVCLVNNGDPIHMNDAATSSMRRMFLSRLKSATAKSMFLNFVGGGLIYMLQK
ncbi:hypothetical protein ACJRO7_015483 [Eucalyptus globulus]|uniref:Uncharacterized protein n=1 Tax=Eucalyptus globulus TaxID=34317 RepID=A0ABD3L3P9_EUCGL